MIADHEKDEAVRPVCNPSWNGAERHARQWAADVGLAVGEARQRMLGRMGQGRMAGYVAPSAGPAELGLLARWGAFIALVDDGLTRTPSKDGPSGSGL
ncbi:MAG: hypothetical protein JO100_14620 [Pseudonocardia sp.]|nr:hypothetical protein [Pseudonocardia sp.]